MKTKNQEQSTTDKNLIPAPLEDRVKRRVHLDLTEEDHVDLHWQVDGLITRDTKFFGDPYATW